MSVIADFDLLGHVLFLHIISLESCPLFPWKRMYNLSDWRAPSAWPASERRHAFIFSDWSALFAWPTSERCHAFIFSEWRGRRSLYFSRKSHFQC